MKSLNHVHDDLKTFSEMAESDISSELLLRALKEVTLADIHWGICFVHECIARNSNKVIL